MRNPLKIYVARDLCGTLRIFATNDDTIPYKDGEYWACNKAISGVIDDWRKFPNVKWDDLNATEVEIDMLKSKMVGN